MHAYIPACGCDIMTSVCVCYPGQLSGTGSLKHTCSAGPWPSDLGPGLRQSGHGRFESAAHAFTGQQVTVVLRATRHFVRAG